MSSAAANGAELGEGPDEDDSGAGEEDFCRYLHR